MVGRKNKLLGSGMEDQIHAWLANCVDSRFSKLISSAYAYAYYAMIVGGVR
jgi:hypothetical protein